MNCLVRLALGCLFFLIGMANATAASALEPTDPETVIRTLIRANAEKDMPTLSRLMAHDADITSYSIGGRKYIGWPKFEREMQEEFATVQRLEIPIHELKVWTKGDVAWFAMEIDYIRYVGNKPEQKRTVLPLRETGVLERRGGQWVLLSFHESFRSVQLASPVAQPPVAAESPQLVSSMSPSATPDLSGEWDIFEVEEDKRYKATLDKSGNGPYTQHGGQFVTTKFADRLWQGNWQQPDNDREGGND
jgi:ketosteroid isomerase-like protein